MGYTLGLDTCSNFLAVAVLLDGETVYSLVRRAERRHSRELMPEVARALTAVGIEAGALEAIGVAAGPGSYTGIRIGMATAEGLARGAAARLVAVPTFRAWAIEHGHPGELVACSLDARGGEVFCALYRREGQDAIAIHAEDVRPAQEFLAMVEKQRGVTLFLGEAGKEPADATGAAGAARVAASGGETGDPLVFHPFYVRQASIRSAGGGSHATGK